MDPGVALVQSYLHVNGYFIGRGVPGCRRRSEATVSAP